MLFTSVAFLRFFLIVLAGLILLRKRDWRQGLILAASAVFYGYWKWSYLFLLAAPSLIDYFCAIKVEEATNQRRRKGWLIVSVVSNLSLLAYFKYANFFLAAVSHLLPIRVPALEITLPVGISFFTSRR